MSLQAWLQERQYARPYHWRQRPNDEREYLLRTEPVFALARLDLGVDRSAHELKHYRITRSTGSGRSLPGSSKSVSPV